MNRSFAIPKTLVLTLAASVLAATASRVNAADIVWDGTTGAFTDPLNWAGDAVPTAADNAIIDNAGTAQIGSADAVAVSRLILDDGAVVQTGGTVSTVPFGTFESPGAYAIGDIAGGTGSYTASGTSELSGGRMRIGYDGGTGSLTLSDSAKYTGASGQDTWVGAGASSVGTLSMSNTSEYLITNDWLVVGRGAQGTLNLSDGAKLTVDNGNAVIGDIDSSGLAVANLTGASKLAVTGELWVGQGGSTGTLNVSGTAGVTVTNNWIAIGRGGGNGTLILSENATFKKEGTTNGNFMVGDQNDSHGTVTVRDNASLIINTQMLVGNGNANSSGTVNLEGGTITVGDWVAIGRDGPGTGILNISGGSFTKNGGGNFIMNGSSGSQINQTGGSLNVASGETWIAEFGDRFGTWTASAGTAILGGATKIAIGGTGTMTISGTADYTSNDVTIGVNGGSTGTLNLNGGTFAANTITKGNGTATLNLNGGVVKANVDSASFFGTLADSDINVQAGGFKFDSGVHIVTVTQALAGTGGLVKSGGGTLEIAGQTTFTGASTVGAGSLQIADGGALGGAVSLDLATNTSLGLNNNISLNDTIVLSLASGSSVDLNFANAETIGSLIINGVGIAPDTYTVSELNALSGGAVLFTGLDGTSALTVTTAVPEPSTVALLVAGGFAVCLMARRRQRA